ncbi:MAG: FAD:protein FMN transferase [Crocinitomicaceae bacterium]
MKHILLVLIMPWIFISCHSNKYNKPAPDIEPAKKEIYGNTQGTTYTVIINDELSITKKEIDSILSEFDMELSTYVDSSFISMFNSLTSGKLEYQSENRYFKQCLFYSKEVYDLSNGSFDPSVLPLVDAWNFFKEDHQAIPDSATIDSLRALIGFENGVHFSYRPSEFDYISKTTPGFRLDFNAIAQGYAVDVVYDFIRSKGGNSFYVEIGGEIRVRGKKNDGTSWVVAVEEPNETKEREAITYIELDEKALATSGNYRKFYEKNGVKYAHTINPKTGYPVQHSLLSATVVAENCAYADAFATMFMVIGVDESMEFVKKHPELNLAVYFIFNNQKNRLEVAYNKTFESLIKK